MNSHNTKEIKERLDSIFGGNYTIEEDEQHQFVRVSLDMPLSEGIVRVFTKLFKPHNYHATATECPTGCQVTLRK